MRFARIPHWFKDNSKLPAGRSRRPTTPSFLVELLEDRLTPSTVVYDQITAFVPDQPGINLLGADESPILSDDGTKIAFGRFENNAYHVTVMNVDGTNPVEVLTSASSGNIDLSANGGRLAFTDSRSITVANGDGTGSQGVYGVDDPELESPRLTADGSRVFWIVGRDTFSGGQTTPPIRKGIYAANLDGPAGAGPVITREQIANAVGAGLDGFSLPRIQGIGLDVSADGSRVIFQVDFSGTSHAVVVGNSDGTNLHVLDTDQAPAIVNLGISGDGSKVFVLGRDFPDSVSKLFVYDFDGSNRRVLSTGDTGINEANDRMQFSFDGSKFLFGTSSLLFNTDGSGVYQLGSFGSNLVGGNAGILPLAAMDASASRVLYAFNDANNVQQLAIARPDPTSLGAAPAVGMVTANPPFILTGSRSTTQVSATVTSASPIVNVHEVFYLPPPTVVGIYSGGGIAGGNNTISSSTDLTDDGMRGDATAGDGVFSNSFDVRTAEQTPGPRTIRVSATVTGADGKLHATAVDGATIQVVTELPAPVLQFSTGAVAVNETDSTVTLTVNRTGVTSGATTVHFATADGTATAGNDYQSTSGDLTFAAGETSKTVTVPLIGDAVPEGAEAFTVTLSAPSTGATLGNLSTATVTIRGTTNTVVYDQITAFAAGSPGVNLNGADEYPVLSDDGSKVAFGRFENNAYHVTVMNADGSNPVEVLTAASSGNIDLSADGGRLAFTDGRGITVANGDGTGSAGVFAVDDPELESPRLTADGSRVFWIVARDTFSGGQNTPPIPRGIYAANLVGPAGAGPVITREQIASVVGASLDSFSLPRVQDIGLDVSADGSRLVFAVLTSTGPRVVAGNTDGTGLHVLDIDNAAMVGNLGISGDGTKVFVYGVGFSDANGKVFVYDFDGSNRRLLTDKETGANEVKDRMRLSTDGSKFFYGTNSLVFDTDGSGVYQVGSFGSSLVGSGGTLPRPAMDGSGSRFLYVFGDANNVAQLAVARLNPTSLGAAPAVMVTANPPFVLTGGRSSTLVSAGVTSASPVVNVHEVFYLAAPTVVGIYSGGTVANGNNTISSSADLNDAGMRGDATAGDGVFSNSFDTGTGETTPGPRTVRVSATVNGADGKQHATAVDGATIQVVTELPAPVLQFSTGAAAVNETDGTVTLTVNRTGDTSGATTVHFATADGTATAGNDYETTSGDLTFAAGEASKTVTVRLTDDFVPEGAEAFTVTLSAPSTGATLGTLAAVTVTLGADNDPTPPTVFQGFVEPQDDFLGGDTGGAGGSQVVLVNHGATPAEDAVRVVDPMTGTVTGEFTRDDFADWTNPSDKTLLGDVTGDGVVELIQFNRPDTSGATPAGGAIRFLNIANGMLVRQINYTDMAGTQMYGQVLAGMVDPEDEVFVGHFTQTANLEALFFNRTAESGSSIVVIDLVTGTVTDRGQHTGGNFGGWLDPTDEFTISDTNFDGFDDVVIVNRVADPENFRTTDRGFVGMVSLNPADSGRRFLNGQVPGSPGAADPNDPNPKGSNIGFYRFFNWNFAVAGQASVFPGYDELADHATFGGVKINPNDPTATPVIVLVNSQFDGNPEAAAYALLKPAVLQQGVPDSFQLVSTQFRASLPASSFNVDDDFLLSDVDADGTDEFLSFSKGSGGFTLRTFTAFTGQLLKQIGDATTADAIGPTDASASRQPATAELTADNDDQTAAVVADWGPDAVDAVFTSHARRGHGAASADDLEAAWLL